MIGNKYNSWTIIGIKKNPYSGKTQYVCKCECGIEKSLFLHPLVSNKSKKCRYCHFENLRKYKIKIGDKFGKWLVLKKIKISSQIKNVCKCECNIESIISNIDLVKGKSTRCNSCYKRDGNPSHNKSKTSTYRIWQSLKYRCLNPKSKDYEYYGARGITVCERWLMFKNFLEDMGEKSNNLQIDRIDNNLGYSKENCRWVTAKQNCNNRRRKNAHRG